MPQSQLRTRAPNGGPGRTQAAWACVLGVVAVAAATSAFRAAAAGPPPVQVRVDGAPLALDPPPFLYQDRTLVPLRGLFTALGATVEWDGLTRTVTATRGDRFLRLQVDRRTACLDPACGRGALLDTPPLIKEGRTFVPLRFAAQVLGARVTWDAATRTVDVFTAGPADPVPVQITAPAAGANITGPVELRAGFVGVTPQQVRWYLLDRTTGRGPLLAIVTDLAAPPPVWRPDPAHAGPRWLVAAAVGPDGRTAYSELVPVLVQPDTAVTLGGLQPEQTITGPVELTLRHGFQSAVVRYERRAAPAGPPAVIGYADPTHPFTWRPGVSENGRWLVEAVATDRTGREYRTPPVPVNVQVAPETTLVGIKAGQELTGPVALRVRANFPVGSVQYYLTAPGKGQVLAAGAPDEKPHLWLPSSEHNGPWNLSAVVYDKTGAPRYTPTVPVNINVRAGLSLIGVGPEQVVSGPVDLRVLANRPFRSVDYLLIDPDTGRETALARGISPAATFRWDPAGHASGRRLLRAAGTDSTGQVTYSQAVPVRVHTGPTFGPRPVMPKDQFLPWAQAQAVAAYRQTGMSAALQVAQAILESGWGQSSPVDKYTGRLSYNLFGIKGTGPAGSVVSNTWEEYDGVIYRIEDRFRAYHSPEESWADHKRFLLERPWYAPFRAVMWNPTPGAWALQRSGYATDSQYPLKLVNLMQQHGLYALDEVEP